MRLSSHPGPTAPAVTTPDHPDGRAPRRIQLRRTRGWRKPEGAVVVTRPHSLFRNPFRVGDTLTFPHNCLHGEIVWDRAHAVAVFRSYVWITSGYASLVRDRLAGRDLACWCPLDQPCHADVLLAIANSGEAS